MVLCKQIIYFLNLNKNSNIFLFDSFGALLSLLLSGLVLPFLTTITGLQIELLSQLILFPTVYLIYSLSSYFFCRFVTKSKERILLMIIIAFNLFYSFMTLSLIFFNESATLIGNFFLFSEILAIVFVVAIEINVLKNNQKV